MSTKGVLIRFSAAYAVLMIAAGLALSYLGAKSNSGLNVAILISTTYWVCASFGQKNKRYFSEKEQRHVVAGMIAIDLLFQLIFLLPILNAGKLNGAILFGIVGFVGGLHALGIYFTVNQCRKQLIKQKIIAD